MVTEWLELCNLQRQQSCSDQIIYRRFSISSHDNNKTVLTSTTGVLSFINRGILSEQKRLKTLVGLTVTKLV